MRYAMIAILTAVCIFFGCPGYLADPSSPWWLRASTYHFFHANLFHLAVNSMAIWSMFKAYPWRKHMASDLVIGYAIATLMFISATRPVVGFSNILFAVIGLRTPHWRSSWWTRGDVDLFFALTAVTVLIPKISAVTHITSLVLGILTAEARRRLSSKLNAIDNDYRRANQ